MSLAGQGARGDVYKRQVLGLGQGWSKDEHDAMGVAMGDRAARADEFLEVMKRAWTDDVVEFDGDFFQIPASVIDLKPVQKPHPPIYICLLYTSRCV